MAPDLGGHFRFSALGPGGKMPRTCLALDYARTPCSERRLCRAPAFGVRQLAGAFARGSVEFEAAWLALWDKSGDKSPQSKRFRAGKTACRMIVRRVRYALNTYDAALYGGQDGRRYGPAPR